MNESIIKLKSGQVLRCTITSFRVDLGVAKAEIDSADVQSLDAYKSWVDFGVGVFTGAMLMAAIVLFCK